MVQTRADVHRVESRLPFRRHRARGVERHHLVHRRLPPTGRPFSPRDRSRWRRSEAGTSHHPGQRCPPTLTGVQIGDVVAFNADAADDHGGEDADDVEENDDDVGIYVGRDRCGNNVFLSSRKTASGPTIGSLGGPSYLNGEGFLAVALRHIRQF